MPPQPQPLHALLRERELSSSAILARAHGHPALARRLAHHATLVGHDGCVNRLSFSAGGALLASASDDRTVRLWRPAAPEPRRALAAVATGHSANIFGVRVVDDGAQVASGGMDSEVRLTPVERGARASRVFRDHDGRVKTVDAHQADPHGILSAAEDGTVRRFDARAPPRAAGTTLLRLDSSFAAKSAAFSPDASRVVVAADAVRVYDARALSCSRASPAGEADALLTLLPAHMRGDAPERSSSLCAGPAPVFATYAAFSDCGRRVVASFHGDAVYTFDARAAGAEDGRGGAAVRVPHAPCRMRQPPPRPVRQLQQRHHLRQCQRKHQRQRASRRLAAAAAALERGANSAAVAAIAAAGDAADGVVARMLRCEAMLRRGWAADWRAALVDADWLHAAVLAEPGLLRELAHSACGSGDNRSAGGDSVCGGNGRSSAWDEGVWRIVLDVQRVKAVLGVLIPRSALSGRAPVGDREATEALRDLLARLQRVRMMACAARRAMDALGGDALWGESMRRGVDSRGRDVFSGWLNSFADIARNTLGRVMRTAVLLNKAIDMVHCALSQASGHRCLPQDGSGAHRTELKSFNEEMGEGDNDGAESADEASAFEASVSASADDADASASDDDADASASDCDSSDSDDGDARAGEERWSSLEEDSFSISSQEKTLVESAPECFWGDLSLQYLHRFGGHLNYATDIKEANFYGATGQCVMAGSDSGQLYVWDASTGAILALLDADSDILNCCVQAPRGFNGSMIATSGIESQVKLWRPKFEDGDQGLKSEQLDELFENASTQNSRVEAWLVLEPRDFSF